MKSNRLCTRAVEWRATNDHPTGDGHTLDGYAAVFGEATEIDTWEGSFFETLEKGCFKKTLRETTPVMQFDHGRDARVGSTPIGVFTDLTEDDQGLKVSGRIFDNPVVEPVRQAIESGAISGMSFKFEVMRDAWCDNTGKKINADELASLLWDAGDRGPLQRTITEIKLFEAGPVVFPAYSSTSVGVRSLTTEERADLAAQYIRSSADPESQDNDEAGSDVDDLDSADDGEAGSDTTGTETDTPEDAGRSVTSTGHANKETTRDAPVTKEPATRSTRKDRVPMETMTVEERESRLSEIRSRLAEIDVEYSGAELPVETQEEWNTLNDEHAEHVRSIDAAVARQEQLARLANSPSHHEGGSDRGTGRSMPSGRRRVADIFDLNEIRNAARGEEDHARLLRENALRAVEQSVFPGSPDRSEAQTTVERLLSKVDDERGTLARRVLTTGSPVYERAFGKMVMGQGLTAEEQRAMSLGTDTAGGFAVPFQLDPTVILTQAGSISPIRQISRVEQITGKEWQGITSAGITVTRSAESAEAADGGPTLAQPVIRPTRVTGFVPFSIELDQDWGMMRSEMTRLLGDAKDQEENSSFVLGNGTPPNPGGIVTTLNVSSQVATLTAASFAAGDVYGLESAIAPRFRGNASFMANKGVYNRIRQFDTAGGAQLWERIGNGQPAELLGYEAYEATAMVTTLTTNSLILLFGDFSQFLIVDRVGMSVELVPLLMGAANRFPTGQRGIYAIWRNSSKVLVDNAFRLLKVG